MENRLNQQMDWEKVEAVVYADTKYPFQILGPRMTEAGVQICCMYPGAKSVSVKVKRSKEVYVMEQLDDAGFFGVLVEGKDKIFKYTYEITNQDDTVWEQEDAYAFLPVLPDADLEAFAQGIHYNIYDILGAHRKKVNGVEGVEFAVWAPNAMKVSVVGDFNLWDGRRHLMEMQKDSGIFALFIPGLKDGDIYKYEIRVKGGANVLKADPYGTSSQMRPENASVIFDISDYKWNDKEYMAARKKNDPLAGPVNIYEVHLGSWKKPEGEDRAFYNYREIAVDLADYVKNMGYTHVELLPVMEHPFDGSWGYQVTGYYAPTSRFGTPADFMYFMDYMHQKGIGVILDWVPAHFPKDAFGLANFDGTCLYEHRDKRQGEHPHWGTLIYNYGRPQVSNFLIANALYWVEKFHADGIRMDAVASMLYLDYGKNDGEWVANAYGGKENLEAIELLKHLNSIMHKRNKNILMIAEESTAWPMVTGTVEEGGLGFNMKWNMGWMNDFLQYLKTDPLFRKHAHGCITFSMMYAYSEKFLLVFSHDEVVHGKGSLINKMPGEYDQKFANLRTAMMFMMGHPGKKFLFMGQEFAQFSEWSEERSLDWNLIPEYEKHGKFHEFSRDLNKLYKNEPSLYEQDFDSNGFEWMSCMDADRSIVSFVRRAKDNDDTLLFVCNFTPVAYENFTQAVPMAGKYKEIFNSDDVKYGGTGMVNSKQIVAKAEPCDGRENSIQMALAPLGTAVFRIKKDEPKKAKTTKKTEKPATEKKAAKKAEKPVAEKKTVKKAEKPVEVEKVIAEPVAEVKAEVKPEEPKKLETKKVEPKLVETKKTEAKKLETKKEEPKKVETKKTEAKKLETKKVEPKKVEAKPEPKQIEKKAEPVVEATQIKLELEAPKAEPKKETKAEKKTAKKSTKKTTKEA